MDSIIDDAIDEAEQTARTRPAGLSPSDIDAVAGHVHTGTMSDEELASVVKDLETKITVVGCGGAGGNTVTRMTEEGIKGAKLVAANTDVQHLVEIGADTKILMGEQKTRAAARARSRRSARRPPWKISRTSSAYRGSDMVFVTAGLGGGTGTGAAPVVAQAARKPAHSPSPSSRCRSPPRVNAAG